MGMDKFQFYARMWFCESTMVHFPVGLLACWLLVTLPLVGAFLTTMFVVYEIVEMRRIHDFAYKDIRSFLFGFGALGFVLSLAIVFPGITPAWFPSL